MASHEELTFGSVSDLAAGLRRRDFTSTELTTLFLDRIERIDQRLNSYITVDPDGALHAAAEADRRLERGNARSVLDGIPIAIKDSFETANLRTTVGSQAFADWVPPTDATVVAKLRGGGAVVLGKNNLHELGLGGTTQNPYFGSCRNPWDAKRIPGGSSGGSAAALAAGLCAAAITADGAGSTRNPAAHCGVVGLKPTHGLISRVGMLPDTQGFSHSDVGLMARTVDDVATLLTLSSGNDPDDPATPRERAFDFHTGLDAEVRGRRFGVIKYFSEIIDREVEDCYLASLSNLEYLGMERVDVSVPHIDLVEIAQWIVVRVERAQALRSALGANLTDFSRDIRFALLADLCIPGSYYVLAQRLRHLLTKEFRFAMEGLDVLAVPSLPMLSPLIEDVQRSSVRIDGDLVPIATPNGGTILTRCSIPFNVTGLPAMSVPAGRSTTGLPIGIQFVGRPYEERMLLRVARAFEISNELWPKAPEFS